MNQGRSETPKPECPHAQMAVSGLQEVQLNSECGDVIYCCYWEVRTGPRPIIFYFTVTVRPQWFFLSLEHRNADFHLGSSKMPTVQNL